MSDFWGAMDLLTGNDRRRTKETFDDIQEWLDTIVSKTQKKINKNTYTPGNIHEISNGDTTGFGSSDTFNSTLSPAINDKTQQNKSVKQKQNKIKKDVQTEKKKSRNKEVYEEVPLPDLLGPAIECSFKLPRVSAQLEKLMGTNVVRLTDRKYMQELREKIQDDYNATLQKRIDQREAVEMERERNLLMGGKGDKVPLELADHPVFIVNKKTNNVISKTRAKLKTNREKTAERLIKQGAKWEKERLIYDELDRQKELELMKKREAALFMENQYTQANKERGMDLLRIRNRDYTECEMGLKNFCDEQREIMTHRLNTPELKIDPNSKDVKMIDAFKKKQREERRRKKEQKKTHDDSSLDKSENIKIINYEEENGDVVSTSVPCCESIEESSKTSKHSKKCKVETKSHQKEVVIKSEKINDDHVDFQHLNKKIEIELLSDEEDNYDIFSDKSDDNYIELITDEEHVQMLQENIRDEIEKGHMLEQKDFEQLHYEDPMILKLKETNNVVELYGLADEIIGGISTAPNIGGKK